MEKADAVSLQIEENLGIIRIDNPPGNYIVRPEFIRISILEEWIEKNRLKGILICGAGKHFSGGADLETLFSLSIDPENLVVEMNRGKDLLRYIECLPIPVVAAIRGICFGGGLEIALSCHIRICSDKALFAFPEVNQGLMPGLGGIRLVSEKASMYETMKLILSGDMINAEEAQTLKLVDHVVPEENLDGFSLTLLNKMTSDRKTKVINYVIKAIQNTKSMSFEEALKEETRMFCELASEERKRRMSNEQ